MHVTEVTFVVRVDGGKRVATFVRARKIADLMTADEETLGSWVRALATEAEDGTRERWLRGYTWIQPDGAVDFTRPRPRPEGLEVDARERGYAVDVGVLRPCPFCKEAVRLQVVEPRFGSGCRAHCVECGAYGPNAPTWREAAERWGAR